MNNKIIQWFPGHMTKAVRLIEENIKIVDAVIYVLDSRAVSACINPSFDRIIQNKPVLYCFNKIDTVDANDLVKWFNFFDKKGYHYVASNSASGRDSAKVLNKLKQLLSPKIERFKQKGVNTPIRSMVIGIPNSGKSTLINSLCRGKKTVTGDRPGVTRAKQWLSVEKGVDLLDTPGTLWPSFDDQKLAQHLAFIGSIKDDILDINDIALHLISFLIENHTNELIGRYNLTNISDNSLAVFEQIASTRGYVIKGGEVDYERTARAILDDFRKQRIGKIMLEFPEDD